MQSIISVSRQCDLLGLSRSAFYYELAEETPENLLYMRLLDEQFTATPYYGVLKMTEQLKRQGFPVNEKRIRRLLRKMGLMAIYPGKRLSAPGYRVEKFPYLLKDLAVVRPNQVWATDITYIRLDNGFLYLTVVMDWFSRYVISWSLGNTMDIRFCTDCLEKALDKKKPEIFNSDQGSQYTSPDFTSILKAHSIQISMDGRGRVFDNIFVERLWRSVKYEEVYLKNYTTVLEARDGIAQYLKHYNETRIHQNLGYKTPSEIYSGGSIVH